MGRDINSGAAALGAGFFLNSNKGAFRGPSAALSSKMEGMSSVPFAPRRAPSAAPAFRQS